jgi:hypothetical protein
MAYTRTFAQLSLAVQQLGQWENSTDITPAVLLQAINYGMVTGYDLMVEKWADYYTLDVNFAIVSGTASYALATIAPNFYKLRHLDVSADGVLFRRVYPYDLAVAHRYSTAGQASSIFGIKYRLQGANLVFNQPPPAGTGKIYWIPLPVQFASTADTTPATFDVPIEEQLVTNIAHRFCLERSDLDTSSIDKALAGFAAGLRTAADSRDAGEPFFLDPGGPPSDCDEDWF